MFLNTVPSSEVGNTVLFLFGFSLPRGICRQLLTSVAYVFHSASTIQGGSSLWYRLSPFAHADSSAWARSAMVVTFLVDVLARRLAKVSFFFADCCYWSSIYCCIFSPFSGLFPWAVLPFLFPFPFLCHPHYHHMFHEIVDLLM